MVTLDTLAVQERHLYLTAQKRLGHPYIMAREAILLMTTFIKSVSHDRVVFVGYMAHLKNHLTMALLSVVRLHHVQAMMDFRQVLETAANAAYALAHPGAAYTDADTGLILDGQGVLGQSYKWLATEYPAHSNDLKGLKENLNANDAHSNLVNGGRVMEAKLDEGLFATPFFDKEDTHIQHTDLYLIVVGALCIMDLITRVVATSGGLEVAGDYLERAHRLEADRVTLARQMTATPRHIAASQASAIAVAAKAAAKEARKPKPKGFAE